MKADITRQTHQPEKHYHRVLHQQGRVPLDADLNEAFAIQEHLDRNRTIDVVGVEGVPKGKDFEVVLARGGADLLVSPGRLYLGGLVCEADGEWITVSSFPAAHQIALPGLTLDGAPLIAGQWVVLDSPTRPQRSYRIASIDAAARTITVDAGNPGNDFGTSARLRRGVSYTSQPDLAAPAGVTGTAVTLADGLYLAYVEAFQHHVTALEDGFLREVALRGADTTTRLKTVWQLKLAASTTADCRDALPKGPANRGALAARAEVTDEASGPCVVVPGAGYRRLENQLYRVEIHGGGVLGAATFKFSRDNGSTVARWVPPATGPVSSSEINIDLFGRDASLAFEANQWIELIDDTREMAGTPGTLVQISSVERNLLQIKTATATGSTDLADFPRNPRVRRWDQVDGPTLAVERPATDDGWIALEDGVEVRFEAGHYTTGDHWIIPARTITGDVEWPIDADGAPLPRARAGIERLYAPLALVELAGGVFQVREDCRTTFPPLTHICAEDICLESDPCGEGLDNVQEAIEHLCRRNDLEFHNRHLHGWGVVCGLQVKCLAVDQATEWALLRPHEHVYLNDGYAIHPTGRDIVLQRPAKESVVDLGTMIVDAGLAQRDAQGKLADVSVSLRIDAGAELHVEAYQHREKNIAQLLAGTIWEDFFRECLLPLYQIMKEQFEGVPGEDTSGPVTPKRKRITTFLNLLWQLTFQRGRFIYLSGDPADKGSAPPNLSTEHGILRDVFQKLRDQLASETFCGMFEDVQFPDYDVYKDGLPAGAHRPSTIFGTGFHTRLRVQRNGRFGATCGKGTKINMYDLHAGKMLAIADFPVAGAEVQDVAFRRNPPAGGAQIVAVALVGANGNYDSVFAVGNVRDNGTIGWSANRVTCDHVFISLVADPTDATRMYAAAQGEGIYTITPDALQTDPPRLGPAINSSGHLVVTQTATATHVYAGGNTSQLVGGTYDHVIQIPAAEPGQTTRFVMQGEGFDDIEAVFDPQRKIAHLFAVTEDGKGKQLVMWNTLAEPVSGAVSPMQTTVALPTKGAVRLAYSIAAGRMFLTLGDDYSGRVYTPLEATLEPGRHPLQIAPASVEAGDAGRTWYALNYMSNTITVVPAVQVGGTPGASTIGLQKLGAYRAAVLAAYQKLFSRLLQYLKDCLCEKFLVDCPHPDDAGKIYLADVSFKDGGVYQICNFSRRKYVHTFPTVEYWMSLVPVIPLLKAAVEWFCCWVIPPFGKEEAAAVAVASTEGGPIVAAGTPAKPATGTKPAAKPVAGKAGAGAKGATPASDDDNPDDVTDAFDVSLVRGLIDRWTAFDAKTRLGEEKVHLLSLASMAKEAIMTALREPVVPGRGAPSVSGQDILNHDSTEVQTRLDEHRIEVDKVIEVGGPTFETLLSTALSPPRLSRKSVVQLYQDPSNKVVGYRRVGAPSDQQALPADAGSQEEMVQAMSVEIETLKAQLAEVRTLLKLTPSG